MKERFYGELNDKNFYAVNRFVLFNRCTNI